MRTVCEMITDGEPLEVISAKIDWIKEQMCDVCETGYGNDMDDTICRTCPLDNL